MGRGLKIAERILPDAGRIAEFFLEVRREYARATEKFGPFNSAHEGYAVLLEEVDELWDEVKKKREKRDHENMYRECVQIAAMAMKFVVSVCKEKSK